jgi:hypothetical protein
MYNHLQTGGPMSQEAVERFWGRMLTDRRFRTQAGESLEPAIPREGLQLNPAELRLLSPLVLGYFDEIAGQVEPALRRVVGWLFWALLFPISGLTTDLKVKLQLPEYHGKLFMTFEIRSAGALQTSTFPHRIPGNGKMEVNDPATDYSIRLFTLVTINQPEE